MAVMELNAEINIIVLKVGLYRQVVQLNPAKTVVQFLLRNLAESFRQIAIIREQQITTVEVSGMIVQVVLFLQRTRLFQQQCLRQL